MKPSLFSGTGLHQLLHHCATRIASAIAQIPAAEVLSGNLDELAKRVSAAALSAESLLTPVRLKNEGKRSEVSEVQIEIVPDEFSRPFGRPPSYQQGTEFAVYIPFEGDAALLSVKPSDALLPAPPKGHVKGKEVVIAVQVTQIQKDEIESRLQRQFDLLKRYLESVHGELYEFVPKLQAQAQAALHARYVRLKEAQDLAKNLRLPT